MQEVRTINRVIMHEAYAKAQALDQLIQLVDQTQSSLQWQKDETDLKLGVLGVSLGPICLLLSASLCYKSFRLLLATNSVPYVFLTILGSTATLYSCVACSYGAISLWRASQEGTAELEELLKTRQEALAILTDKYSRYWQKISHLVASDSQSRSKAVIPSLLGLNNSLKRARASLTT